MKIFARILAVFMIFCSGFMFASCKKKYLVAFEVDGGTEIESVTVSKIKEAPVTTKEGYEFLGWFSDPRFSNVVEFPVNITEDVTFYAKWRKTLAQFKKEYDETFKGSVEFEKSSLVGYADKINFKTKVGVTGKLAENQQNYEESGIQTNLFFAFGNFAGAYGDIVFNYKKVLAGAEVVDYTVKFMVTSLVKSGNKYIINGYMGESVDEYSTFFESEDWVREKIQMYFDWSWSEVSVLVGSYFSSVIYNYA